MNDLLVYGLPSRGHAASGHPERPERVDAVVEGLREVRDPRTRFVGAWPPLDPAQAPVHEPVMVQATRDLAARGGGWLDADTFVTAASFDAALHAAGAVLDAAHRVLRGEASGAFCAVRPPGHHATRSAAMGFCLLNNVALAADAALREGLARRVLVFDHDVHHGNGTQDVFERRADVLYQSFHLWPHYPGAGRVDETGSGDGAGFTVNAPLPRGCGEAEVAALLHEVFLPVAREFRPDLVLVSAGFDSHAGDPLGGLALSSATYGRLVAAYRAVCPRVVCVLEGGYNLAVLGACARGEAEALLGRDVGAPQPGGKVAAGAAHVVKELKAALRLHWKF